MDALALPTNLVDSVHADALPERYEWLRALPDIVGDVARRWSLRLGPPFQPGGRCAWVAPARTVSGKDVVLKVAWQHEEAIHEADGLRAWAGHGAVGLYDSDAFDSTSVLLLERCDPGTTLAVTRPEPEQDEIVAGLLTQLWTAPVDGSGFRPLQVMCDAWAAQFQARLGGSTGPLDAGLARAGIELFRALPGTAERQVLLCTDLHAGNVLAARRRPWLVIDPKPYWGDPTYDALQHLLNCMERLSADPVGLAGRMADLLGLDRDRLVRWLFARCVQESIGQPVLADIAARLAPA
jgi:streptomycin 6-kinase